MIPAILPVKCYNGILCACGILYIRFALINTNTHGQRRTFVLPDAHLRLLLGLALDSTKNFQHDIVHLELVARSPGWL